MPERSTEAKNLDDDEQKIYENFTQLNKVTEEHSQQQARRAYPTAGENQKNRKEQCQLQAETYLENNVSKKEVGPMTRNKDVESHQRMATEQESKVAEKAREHQLEIEEGIEVEEKKMPS